MAWHDLNVPLEGHLSEKFATRIQFFDGPPSDDNHYFQIVIGGNVDLRSPITAKFIYRWRRFFKLNKTFKGKFSQAKKHQWLHLDDGRKLLISKTYNLNGPEGGEELPENVRVRINPPIHVNDFDLRSDLNDDDALGEHFPEEDKVEKI